MNAKNFTIFASLLISSTALATESTEAPIENTVVVAEDDGLFTRRDRRTFNGLGFHSHFDIGVAYGQQSVGVSRVDAQSLVTGEEGSSQEVASGLGVGSRLELWPAYGRYAGVGVYGEGAVGAMQDDAAGSAMFSGSGGVVLQAGAPRLRAMVTVGRSRRGGAYAEGTNLSGDISKLSTDAEVTAGMEDTSSYRAGVGASAVLSRNDRAGVDVWLMFDQASEGGPAVALPDFSDSAMTASASLWFRNALVVTGEVSVRGEQGEDSLSGTGIAERTAMVRVGWSMDRFSRAY